MTLDAIRPSIAELQANIMRCFTVEPVPDRSQIISHECDECCCLRDDFVGKRWIDIPREIVDDHYSCLSLFTPTAHRYYLPAFLLRALQPEGEMWGTVVDFVIYDLCPDDEEWWRSRFEIFSPEQMQVVGSWLALVLGNPNSFEGDDAVGRRGYERYWRVS